MQVNFFVSIVVGLVHKITHFTKYALKYKKVKTEINCFIPPKDQAPTN